MGTQKTLKNDFKISVSISYVASESRPEEGYHFFAYKVTIQNQGDQAARLMARHWIITDSQGKIEEVRGPGVVGAQPRIIQGKNFQYESACPLNTPCGSMKGYYSMLAEDGESFQVEIPEFYLIAPQALH